MWYQCCLPLRFLLSLGTVQTVWYPLFLILFEIKEMCFIFNKNASCSRNCICTLFITTSEDFQLSCLILMYPPVQISTIGIIIIFEITMTYDIFTEIRWDRGGRIYNYQSGV